MARHTIFHSGFAIAAAIIIAIIVSRFDFSVLQIAALAIASMPVAYLASLNLLPDAKSQAVPPPQPARPVNLSAMDVLDVFPNPSIIVDGQGISLIVNPAAKQAFRGLEIGIGFNQWFRDANVLATFSKVKASGKPAYVELIEINHSNLITNQFQA